MARPIGGIGGIERKIAENQAKTDQNISEAFQDLKKLMSKAKEMTQLSATITARLKEKGNKDISDDETILLKSYLLKLGVNIELEDVAKRTKFANESDYYKELGKQVAKIVKPLAEKSGGQMALTDVFCVVNRARGLELISAEDLLNACFTLESQQLGARLIKYESGLMVIQLNDYNQEKVNSQLKEIIDANYTETLTGMTSNQIALRCNISMSLARQRLINCESMGFLCRDECIQGLLFFPNKFLQSS